MKPLSIITAAAIALSAFSPNLALAESTLGTGSFTGANDHITTGGVSVVKTSNGDTVVILGENFSLDGAPEPSVGFGKDGEYAKATDLGDLGELNGLQAFVVPASVNVADYNEIYIWCDKFNVSLGVASLE